MTGCQINRMEGFLINTETKMYIIRSLNMTNWLCNLGHKILKVEDSEIDPRFKVFFFADTKELHISMARFNREV